MERARRGEASELMNTLIAYWWKDMFRPFDRDPADIQWLRPIDITDDNKGGAR